LYRESGASILRTAHTSREIQALGDSRLALPLPATPAAAQPSVPAVEVDMASLMIVEFAWPKSIYVSFQS